MKKVMVCVLVCMLMITTMSIVGAYPKLKIDKHKSNTNAMSKTNDGNETWMKTFGGWKRDAGASVEKTLDGGYIIIGRTASYGAGGYDIWLIKTDSQGEKIWDKTYGGKYSDWSYSGKQTNDRGFIITGTRGYSPNEDSNSGDIWLIKTDEEGNQIWNKTFDYGIVECGMKVIQTSDDGFLVLATAFNATSSPDLYTCVYLIKTDENGDMMWDKKFEGNSITWGSIVETPDHHYVGVGSSHWDVWVFKTDTSGELVWDKTYGGSQTDLGSSLIVTNDGKYLVVAHTASFGAGGSDIWLLKLSDSGEILQNMTIGRKFTDEAGMSIISTNDGGYMIAGIKTWKLFWWHRSNGLLVKLTSDLTVEWTKTVGGFGNHGLLSVQQTTDNSYVMCGSTTKFLNENIWLVKTT